MPLGKIRLDRLLVERGLAENASRARALILSGQVCLPHARPVKPSLQVDRDVAIRLNAPARVGRGAEKLASVWDELGLEASGRTVLDVGASTGGFTELLLEKGAARVYAVDVGRGLLHPRLRHDPRVRVMEGVNFRYAEAGLLPEKASLCLCDVSFISLKHIVARLPLFTKPGGFWLLLVKPQFELDRKSARGGVVRDEELREVAVERVAGYVAAAGGKTIKTVPSKVSGRKGNREVFLLAQFAP